MKGTRLQLQQAIAPWRARYEALASREQWLVAAAAVVVAMALVHAAVWQPFANARRRHAQEVLTAHGIANQLSVAEAELQRGRPAAATPVVGRDVSLLSAVDQAAKSGTLTKPPSRMQPEGDNQARVWLEDVPFDVLLRWMFELQNSYGVRIDVADIERQPTSGLVNARLSLIRAP